MARFFLFPGVEVDDLADGAVADFAEFRVFVGAHAAVGAGAIDAFYGVSRALEDTDGGVACSLCRGGHGRSGRDEVLPLAVEVCQRGDVMLPRLDVVWVHGHLLRLVGILVGEACEAVAELMHDDGFEFLVVCHREVVGVENAPSAVEVGVHQDDDVLVRCPGEPVVECFQVERGEVAVAVEGVEM